MQNTATPGRIGGEIRLVPFKTSKNSRISLYPSSRLTSFANSTVGHHISRCLEQLQWPSPPSCLAVAADGTAAGVPGAKRCGVHLKSAWFRKKQACMIDIWDSSNVKLDFNDSSNAWWNLTSKTEVGSHKVVNGVSEIGNEFSWCYS